MATQTLGQQLPPLASGIPFIGHTLSMVNAPLDFIVEEYKKTGPLFRVKMLGQHIWVAAGLEANQFFSRNANTLLRSDEVWGSFANAIDVQNIVLSQDGEPHIKLRKMMMRGYSPKMITNRFPKAVDITKRILNQQFKQSNEVNVVAFMQQMVTEQLGILLANKAPGKYAKYMQFYLRTLLNVTVLKTWPKLMLKHPKYVQAEKKVHEFGQMIINEHRANTNPEFPDLVDDVLAAYDAKEVEFTPQELLFTITGPFLAGLDTVANTLSSMIYAIAKNRDVMVLLQQEVDTVFKHNIPDLATLRRMEVMHGVALETLRLYPVAPMIPRTARETFEFNGYTIPKGETVYVAQGVTHFLPELFPNPYEFDVHRYQETRNEHRTKGAYMPFGIGAHKCLGNRLAEVQMMLTMATIVSAVDFQLVPENYELRMSSLPTLGPESSFKVRLLPRRL